MGGFCFCARYLELFDCLGLPSWCCRNGAAKMTPSWVVIIALPNLQQVWFKYAKLAASMAILAILGVFLAAQAILGVFLAAPGSMIMLVRSSRFIVGSLKLRINGCLQIRRQSSCFSCAFHMRQRIGTKLDVYGCFDSPLNAQIREKPPLNTSFAFKNHPQTVDLREM